ncbi:MAG: polyamine aminopropyltransferase [Sulfuriferula sp.]
MRFFKRRIHKAVSDLDTVEISEQDGVRFLHLGNDTVQSAMRLSDPNGLELSYTRAMLGFLLLVTPPENVLLLGLGGGSLAKFLYRRLPETNLVAVEINSQVITAARAFFQLPPDDERLRVVHGDASSYIIEHLGWDAILLDGFDSGCQVESLATQDFYDHCAMALTQQGVLSVNLWGSDPNFEAYLKRIETAFDGRILCLPAERRGNVIVFGFASKPRHAEWETLRNRASRLEAQLGLEFTNFVDGLRVMNEHDHKGLT